MHLGGGAWVVVDSCADLDGTPAALRYLDSIGVEPAGSVEMVIATHWHDDHIRGLARILETCPDAAFCCASALCEGEILAMVGALEGNRISDTGSGLRELHDVFSLFRDKMKKPVHAIANRVVFQRHDCRLWALSPDDGVFQEFLKSVGRLVPPVRGNKRHIPSLSPNKAAVALWVECDAIRLLLGADLERQGWGVILGDSARPPGKASVFKVPHHGSANANEPEVWQQMLQVEPFAVLTPWRRGGRVLPTSEDARRVSEATPNAWITNKSPSGQARFRHGNTVVEKTLRESGLRIRRPAGDTAMVRLRRPIVADSQWTVEAFGGAGRLVDHAA